MANSQVRISGVDLPLSKRIEVGLTEIYGIGISTSRKILNLSRVDFSRRVYDLSEEEISRIRSVLESGEFILEGDLRQRIYQDIKRLRDIRCYRGIRHRLGLPVRGQITRHNAHTRKGKHIAVGGLKKKIDKK